MARSRGSPHHNLAQGRGKRLRGGGDVPFRHQRPAEMAVHFWPALGCHLLDDLGGEQVELGRTGGGGRSQHGRVERVGLDVEPDRPLGDRRMGAQRRGGGSRAGEGDAVLAAEAVQQAAEFTGGRAPPAAGTPRASSPNR